MSTQLMLATSAAVSAIVSAFIVGVFTLRVKRKEYVNDYYKTIIHKRISAYEEVEKLIVGLKACHVADDNRPYHTLFSSEETEDWFRAFALIENAMSQGLWLTDDVFLTLAELNYLVYHSKKPESVIEFAKTNYESIASIRQHLEILLARDMLLLHDVKHFLKSKNRPDPGLHRVALKR